MKGVPRLYPILDTCLADVGVEEAARAMVDGGTRILQIRHKGHWSRTLFESAQRVRDLCIQYGTVLVINDRADFALLLDAALHVGQDDLAPADARRLIGPDRTLGFSTHNAVQLESGNGEPVDYLAIGPIFGTRSKANPDPEVGLQRLRELRRLTNKPLVAIGGITRLNARAVLEAGADSVAVIADLVPDPYTKESIRERVKEWLQLLK